MEKIEYEIMYNLENTYWWYCGLHELIEKCLRRRRKEKSIPLLMLDAGCGTGRMMERVRQFGQVEGIDFSEEALRFCALRGVVSVTRQDLNTWCPPREKYDSIISCDVLSHSSIRGEEEVLRFFFTALKPGALLLLHLPAFEFLRRGHDAAVHTGKRYSKRQIADLLKHEGFSISYASYRLPFLFIIMLVKKTIEKAFPGRAGESDLKPLPRWLNGILLLLTRAENQVLLSGASLPFGGSLFIIATK